MVHGHSVVAGCSWARWHPSNCSSCFGASQTPPLTPASETCTSLCSESCTCLRWCFGVHRHSHWGDAPENKESAPLRHPLMLPTPALLPLCRPQLGRPRQRSPAACDRLRGRDQPGTPHHHRAGRQHGGPGGVDRKVLRRHPHAALPGELGWGEVGWVGCVPGWADHAGVVPTLELCPCRGL